jgi:hypothetical protein
MTIETEGIIIVLGIVLSAFSAVWMMTSYENGYKQTGDHRKKRIES